MQESYVHLQFAPYHICMQNANCMPFVNWHEICEFQSILDIIYAIVFIYWTILGFVDVFYGSVCITFSYSVSEIKPCILLQDMISYVRNFIQEEHRAVAHFRLSFVLMALVVLYTGIAASQDQAVSKGGTIDGHIKDTTLLESPINGVRVVFVNADRVEFETQTDAEGAYKHAGLPAGRYLVNVYKPGYEDRVGMPVSVIDGGRHYVPLTMNKAENIVSAFQNLLGGGGKRGGVLRFWVYSNTKPAVPLDGVEIKITRNESVITGISNTAGQYRSDRLPAGGYIVTIDKDDYHVVCPMTVHENRITDARITLSTPNKIADSGVPSAQESGKLKAKNVLRGKIREMVPFEALLSGVEVEIRGVDGIAFKGTSNADGVYECIGLPAGRYLINLHKDGYIDQKGIPMVVANDGNHIVAVIEEGMFVSYAVVANGNLLEFTHGMRRE